MEKLKFKKNYYTFMFYLNVLVICADVLLFAFVVPHNAMFLAAIPFSGIGAWGASKRLEDMREPTAEEKQAQRRKDWLKLVGKEDDANRP